MDTFFIVFASAMLTGILGGVIYAATSLEKISSLLAEIRDRLEK